MSDDSKQPTQRAYILIDRKNSDGEDTVFWLNVGSVFPHKDGKGANLILDAMPPSVDGKYRLSTRDIKEPEPEPQKKHSKK